MADISRNSFDATKGYQEVIFQQVKPLLDFDLNEAQQILTDRIARSVAAMLGEANLLGGSGFLSSTGGARTVAVAAGAAMQNGVVILWPAVASLQVFGGGTVSGIHTSTVYCEWWDEEIDSAEDAGILDATFGESARRTKRNVTIGVNIGSASLPTFDPGRFGFKIGTVTHDFAGGTTILATDITMEASGPTSGEWAGKGPIRSLRAVSRAATAATAVGFISDTVNNLTTAGAKLVSWRNQGVEKAWLDKDGNFSGGTINGVLMSSIGPGGNAILHNALQGLATGDPHTQYVALAAARTITAQHTFAPATAIAPFVLGVNALGRLVSGLNADQLDGQEGSFYQSATNLNAGTLAAARLPSEAVQTGTAQTLTAKKTLEAASATVLFATRVTADTVDRLALEANGKLAWGPGNGAADTNLYRSAADTLKTDDKFQANQLESTVATGTAPLVVASTTLVANLNAERFGGQLAAFYQSASNLNAGTLADARLSANVMLLAAAQVSTGLKTFQAGGATADVLDAQVAGDAQKRFATRADGRFEWGSGAAVRDTNLYRSAADLLRTDDGFSVGGTLAVTGASTFTGAAAFAAALSAKTAVTPIYDNVNSAAFNFANSNIIKMTMNGAKSVTMTGGVAGGVYVIKLKQDGTGGRLASWAANVKWTNDVPPTLSTAANREDTFTFLFDGTNYLGVISGIGYIP